VEVFKIASYEISGEKTEKTEMLARKPEKGKESVSKAFWFYNH
jgi:hypothetical protein